VKKQEIGNKGHKHGIFYLSIYNYN